MTDWTTEYVQTLGIGHNIVSAGPALLEEL